MEQRDRFSGGSDGSELGLTDPIHVLSGPPSKGGFLFAREGPNEDDRHFEKSIEVANARVTQPSHTRRRRHPNGAKGEGRYDRD